MKANELMIGDWVYLTDPDTNRNEIIKVSYTDLSNAIAKYLEPIPLTPEILEKNRWKNEGFFSSLQTGDYKILTDGNHVAVIHKDHADIDIPIKFVHELQHVLKLCRIEKEITL